MSLLFPAMLIGLVGLAVPVALHLIARHKYQVLEFPSLRLLQADERSNVFAMRLVDAGQLALRLLVLALVVLAMARLFASCATGSRAPRNLVVVFDCSASMRLKAEKGTTLFDQAKARARELLGDIRPPSRCALLAATDALDEVAPLQPTPDQALAALAALRTTDGSGCGLVRAVARACDLVAGRREARSQIVVLTDLRSTAFEARSQRDTERIREVQRSLGNALDIALVNLAPDQTPNLAITHAAVRGSRVKVDDDAHVIATVRNCGKEAKPVSLRLEVGDRREPAARQVTVEPGSTAHVDLTLRVSRAARAFVQARLDDADPLEHDNAFALPLDVADARRVLIVHEGGASTQTTLPSPLPEREGDLGPPLPSRERTPRPPQAGGAGEGGARERLAAPSAEAEDKLSGARILQLVLNPGRELGRAYGTGIRTTAVTPEALAAQPLSQYDLVALYDVSALPEQALKDLDTFAKQGRSLLFICSRDTNAMKFNRTFAAGGEGRGRLAPSAVGNDVAAEPPIGLKQAGSSHPLLAPFRDRLKGDLSAIRFAAVREVRDPAPGASAVLHGTDGRPLAVEMPLGRGKALLLAFGFELSRGTIARTRAFPALMWHLVAYLTGDLAVRRPDVLTATRTAALDASDAPFAFLSELELAPAAGQSLGIPIRDGRTVLLPGLPAGRYLLQKPSQGAASRAAYSRPIAVNPDPRESDPTPLAASDATEVFGPAARLVGGGDALDLAVRGAEPWLPVVGLLLLAYGAEGAVGWLLSARREKQRGSHLHFAHGGYVPNEDVTPGENE
ncbi:MAG: VWA domain-containing protein [Planctomycetes bacterium]|nr:VWA domain-containing protein [Planctomycetota bacterium]